MSPLFMDTGYEPNSPGSLSAEESHSNTAGSEREGEAQQTRKRGSKRQEKNRDAARKSRKKQTERADELHEELQCLERSNSELKKEISSLKKDLQLYTTALERHESVCCLQKSSSNCSSTAHLLGSLSADCQTGSSPPGISPQASSSAQAAVPSFSTSLTSSLSLQTTDCVQNTYLSSSAPAPTTTIMASSTASSSELLTSSRSSTVPYSASFSAVPAPHSLFCKDPISPVTSWPADVTPVRTSQVSNPVPCSGTLDAFYIEPASFPAASSNVVPPYSHLAVDNECLVAQVSAMNAIQLHSHHFSRKPSPPPSILPSTFQDPTLQSLSVSPQANLEPSTASAFPLKPSYSEYVTPNPASLLSLLTTPSPLTVSQTTSSSFDGHLSVPPPSPQPAKDISLSEFLEVNDWILQ